MEWSQYDFLLSLKIYEKYLQSLEPHHRNVLARELAPNREKTVSKIS